MNDLSPLENLNILLSLFNAALFLVLFVWSLLLVRRPDLPRAFQASMLFMYLLTGAAVVLHFVVAGMGQSVPTGRDGAHLRYVFFQLATVVAAHLMFRGTFSDPRTANRFMWLVTLFGFGVAFEAFRVCVVYAPGT